MKKAEHQRIDAFELWCWRRLLRVPWTARRSNLSILKINPGCSLEGLMLKLKLQYSCLENPMGGGTWWATVHGVAKTRTRLSDFTSLHFLLGRKAMTNPESILKSRDITLPIKVNLFKAMVLPVVMDACESWTIKKAEC